MINLTPVKGNIHCFTAITDTIMFDVLTPYYDQETRFCNFYMEVESFKPKKSSKKMKAEKNNNTMTPETGPKKPG